MATPRTPRTPRTPGSSTPATPKAPLKPVTSNPKTKIQPATPSSSSPTARAKLYAKKVAAGEPLPPSASRNPSLVAWARSQVAKPVAAAPAKPASKGEPLTNVAPAAYRKPVAGIGGGGATSGKGTSGSWAPEPVYGPTAPPPKYGTTSNYVLSLQNYLKNNGFDPGPRDGIYGPKTLAALKAYEAKKGAAPWTTIANKALPERSTAPLPASSKIAPPPAGSAGRAHVGGAPLTTWKNRPVGTQVAKDLAAWEKETGIPINITDGYRTYAQQAALKQQKPGLAAAPGTSYHERGLAIDVDPASLGGYNSPTYKKFVAWMQSRGYTWGGTFSTHEVWHFGYGE